MTLEERKTSYTTASATRLRLDFDPQEIDNPVLSFFFNLWNARRGDRAMPARAQFTMRDMAPHLGWVSFIDVLPKLEEFRFRLVGSRVAQYFLGDGTGKTVREAFAGSPPRFVENVLKLYRAPCTTKRPVRIIGPGGFLKDVYFPDYDALYLPLAEDGANVNMLMNVFTFDYDEFRRKRGVDALASGL